MQVWKFSSLLLSPQPHPLVTVRLPPQQQQQQQQYQGGRGGRGGSMAQQAPGKRQWTPACLLPCVGDPWGGRVWLAMADPAGQVLLYQVELGELIG